MNDIKFNFIIECADEEIEKYKKIDIDAPGLGKLLSRGDKSWCLQTYLRLSKRGSLPIMLSNKLHKHSINLVHSDQLVILKGNSSDFIVCVRADYPTRPWAHYHLVQNKNQLSANTSFLPHWPQPGLIPRDRNRNGVTRVAYAGQTFNGNLAGSTDDWKNTFARYGIEFTNIPDSSWHDLAAIDILIGIRSFDKNPHNTKPPTKLLNAWLARIPFIGGYDSAFMQMGAPGEDYLLVETPQDAVEAVLSLKNDAGLYTKLVKNGIAKATQYTTETIAEIWEQTLTGVITNRYKKWEIKSSYEKLRFNTLLNLGIMTHKSKQVIKTMIKGKV